MEGAMGKACMIRARRFGEGLQPSSTRAGGCRVVVLHPEQMWREGQAIPQILRKYSRGDEISSPALCPDETDYEVVKMSGRGRVAADEDETTGEVAKLIRKVVC